MPRKKRKKQQRKQTRSFLSRMMFLGFRKGVLEGSRPWLVTGAAAGTVRIIQRLGREAPATVFSEELAPGEGVEIRVLPPEG